MFPFRRPRRLASWVSPRRAVGHHRRRMASHGFASRSARRSSRGTALTAPCRTSNGFFLPTPPPAAAGPETPKRQSPLCWDAACGCPVLCSPESLTKRSPALRAYVSIAGRPFYVARPRRFAVRKPQPLSAAFRAPVSTLGGPGGMARRPPPHPTLASASRGLLIAGLRGRRPSCDLPRAWARRLGRRPLARGADPAETARAGQAVLGRSVSPASANRTRRDMCDTPRRPAADNIKGYVRYLPRGKEGLGNDHEGGAWVPDGPGRPWLLVPGRTVRPPSPCPSSDVDRESWLADRSTVSHG